MFIPFHLIGLAITGSMALSKTGVIKKISNVRTLPNHNIYRNKPRINLQNRINPLSGLIKSVNNITQRVTDMLKKEDYDQIAQRFIPIGAQLIIPQYPQNSGTVFTADLDADKQNELIAAYSYNNEISIFILKKLNDQWVKVSELNNAEYAAINYLGFADITGSGSKNLLVGWDTKESYNRLDIYSLDNSEINKIAHEDYSRLEITDFSGKDKTATGAEIAIWTKTVENTYAIDVLKWDGQKLAIINDPVAYYARSVVPFYGQKIRSNTASASDWYLFSKALLKAQMYRDALISIQMGMQRNQDILLDEKFAEIKKEIETKIYN